MKRKGTKKPAKIAPLRKAMSIKKAELGDAEIPDMSRDESFWSSLKPFEPPQTKTQLTLRLDQDVLDWFREKERGYQTHMNAALRSYMEHASAKKNAGRRK